MCVSKYIIISTAAYSGWYIDRDKRGKSYYIVCACILLSLSNDVCIQSVSVYGALYHGQYITQWDAASKEMVACHCCQQHCQNSSGQIEY